MKYVCKKCSSENMTIEKTVGVASLICRDCNRLQRFLSETEIREIEHDLYEQALERNREDNRQLKLW